MILKILTMWPETFAIWEILISFMYQVNASKETNMGQVSVGNLFLLDLLVQYFCVLIFMLCNFEDIYIRGVEYTHDWPTIVSKTS